eukprot:Selendium_serpulae@DN6187_c0_g1_i5.p3
MTGTLCSHVECLDQKNYESLAQKLTVHGSKLLKKPDQCRAVLNSSHLYWENPQTRDPGRVLECLKKCLTIADSALEASSTNVYLLVEILNAYLYYFEAGNTWIESGFISKLITLCCDHLSLQETEQEVKKHFVNTLKSIKIRQTEGTKTQYQGIDLNSLLKETAFSAILTQ